MINKIIVFLICIIVCVLGSGCASCMQVNNITTGPPVPPAPLIATNSVEIIDEYNNFENNSLINFIRSYNRRLSQDQAAFIAQSIMQMSDKYKVNYKIITAMVAIESGFRADARSPSGALGLGQLMPATARGLNVNNPYDPFENLNATVKLFRTHLEKYQGDINFALAAYKMGAGTVKNSGISQSSTIDYIKSIRKVFDSVP